MGVITDVDMEVLFSYVINVGPDRAGDVQTEGGAMERQRSRSLAA